MGLLGFVSLGWWVNAAIGDFGFVGVWEKLNLFGQIGLSAEKVPI